MKKGIFLQTFVVQNQGDIDRSIHSFGFDLDYHIKKVISDCGVVLDCPCSDCDNGFSPSPTMLVAPGDDLRNAETFGVQMAHPSEVPTPDVKTLQAAIEMLASQVMNLQREVAALKAK